MRFFLGFLICFSSFYLRADTIDNYVNISNNIPRMEMKADEQAQAWARSARNVLEITNESIAETLIQANEFAKNHGGSLFCLPPNISLNASVLNALILQTYREISSSQSDKNKMTVSQVAWLGVAKRYPCQANPINNTVTNTMLGLTHIT